MPHPLPIVPCKTLGLLNVKWIFLQKGNTGSHFILCSLLASFSSSSTGRTSFDGTIIWGPNNCYVRNSQIVRCQQPFQVDKTLESKWCSLPQSSSLFVSTLSLLDLWSPPMSSPLASFHSSQNDLNCIPRCLFTCTSILLSIWFCRFQ